MDLRANLCAGRRIKVQFQGVGAPPWLVERRNGLAGGIYNRLVRDDGFSNKRIPSEALRRLKTVLSASGFCAYPMVLGSNPMDPFGWEDQDEDLTFAQDSSLAGQFDQQRKRRMRAQEATLKEIANSELRRLLARNKSLNCADVSVGIQLRFIRHKVGKARRGREGPRRFGILTRRALPFLFKVKLSKLLGIAFECA